MTDAGPHFLDPVENRIAAITQAVDAVADALVVGGDAEQSAQCRDDMMRHLAHDLRSPLVSLRALADQLRVGSPADQAAMIARVDACARRSLDLTEQFLLIGRAQSLDSSRFAEVDLVQLLHACADDLWEDAQSQGARVQRQCAARSGPGDGRRAPAAPGRAQPGLECHAPRSARRRHHAVADAGRRMPTCCRCRTRAPALHRRNSWR